MQQLDSTAGYSALTGYLVPEGRQDAMQRQSLVPLRDFMLSKGTTDGAGMQLLEIGSGTGRFATFVKVISNPLRTYKATYQ